MFILIEFEDRQDLVVTLEEYMGLPLPLYRKWSSISLIPGEAALLAAITERAR